MNNYDEIPNHITNAQAYFEYAKKSILPFSFWDALKESELFFVFFSKLSYAIFENMQFLYVVIAFTFIFFTFKGILYYESQPILSLLFLFASTTFFISLNAMRQMASFAIFLYANKYIFSKQFKKYIFYIALAFFWHTSAIIYIAFYFLPNLKIRKCSFLIIVFSYLFKLILNKFVIQFLENTGIPIKYYFTLVEGASSKSFLLISFVIWICFTIFAKGEDKKLIFLYNISLIGVTISIFVDGIPGGYRLVYIFWPMYIVICPYIIRKAKNWKILLFSLFLSIFIIYFYRQHIIGNSGEVVPYNSIFFK